MTRNPSHALGIILGFVLSMPAMSAAQITEELDAYWAEASRTVAEGDFDGYAVLYHPDAVLVSSGAGNSHPIADALSGWEQYFVDTREGRADASVEFRLTQRLHDATTAHETGIFRFTFEPDDSDPTDALMHFESLLVKKDGGWLMVMEYQKEPATEAEWEAAAESP